MKDTMQMTRFALAAEYARVSRLPPSNRNARRKQTIIRALERARPYIREVQS